MSEVKVELVDSRSRRIARERFDRPVILEAGAGTGKTRALIERLLAWTVEFGWKDAEARLAERSAATPAATAATAGDLAAAVLEGVVAITFTDAAAAEMAARLGEALARLASTADGKPPSEATDLLERLGRERVRERAAALGAELSRARIQTIHAFCRALLAVHPFDAGLHPAFEVDADGETLERIAFEVLSARLAGALAAGDRDWLDLLADGVSPEEILEAVAIAVETGVSPEELDADPYPPERLEAIRVEAGEAIRSLLPVLGPFVAAGKYPKDKVHALYPLLQGIAVALDDGSSEQLVAVASSLRLDRDGLRDQLKTWGKGDSTARIEKAAPAGAEPLPVAAARTARALSHLATFDPERLGRARRVVAPLLRETRERMRRGGSATYDELLSRAAALLADRPDVRASVRSGIRQLLVDEFQDTDRRQCELVALLALDGDPETRPGLFVVGDPKQSIYGWRSADLAAYEKFLERVRAAGAEHGRLEVNFRSLPAVLAEVDRVVRPSMRREDDAQPSFEALVASEANVERERGATGAPAVELWWSADERVGKTPLGVANRIEARALAAEIVRLRSEDASLRLSDFALLFRAGSDFETYLQELREAGIDFAIERDRSYWRRREVIDVAAALRAVIDPGDHLALVTLLRSPYVGVPDAALSPLWRERLPDRVDRLVTPDPAVLAGLRELLTRIAAELSPEIPGIERIAGWEKSAFAALEALAELREAFGGERGESGERFLERFRTRFAFEPTAAARFLGRFGAANLERFFRELGERFDEVGDDPVALARFLRRAVAERRDAQEARPATHEADAVRVMTIHGAKGLEFRHVFLLQTHKESGGGGRGKPFEALRAADGALAYGLLGSFTLAWTAAEERRDALAERERVRLLYVAMTRAKDRLTIAGQFRSERGRGNSFLDLLAERFAASPFATGFDASSPVTPTRDAHGALWRIPGLEAELRAAAQRSEERSEERAATRTAADPAQLARDLDELTARRARAAERAARPRFARASDFGPPFRLELEEGEEDATVEARGRRDKSSRNGSNDGRSAPETSEARSLARTRGVALHRALELQPLAGESEAEWRSASQAAFLALRPAAERAEIGELAELAALDRDLTRLKSSLLWKQLLRLSGQPDRIVARELPVLVSAGVEPASLSESGIAPIDGFVGTLDLLYRDAASSELVVADFKSDEVDSEDGAAALVARYRPQLSLYGRAVQDALSLAAPPRLELWLLALDRIEVVAAR